MRIPVLASVICLAVASVTTGQHPVASGSLERHVSVLASDSLLGRGFGTDQGKKAAGYIAEEFRKAGIEPYGDTYFHPFVHRIGILNIKGVNVVGRIRGQDPVLHEEYILLTAHYDHLGWKVSGEDTVVFNGADDNASGVASLIEIGRNLASEIKPGALGRSVLLVAFDGEESGLIGSRQFLREPVVPPHRIKLVLNLDMVGMYREHGGLDLRGIGLLYESGRWTGTLADSMGIVIRKENRRIAQQTDTAPFGELGIPAVHAFTGTESPYHQPDDRAEKLDYEGMALIADYLSALALEASVDQPLSPLEGPEQGEQLAAERQAVRLGVSLAAGPGKHNYLDEFYEGKPILAGEAGFFLDIKAFRFLSIQPGLFYETKGSRHPVGTFRTHSVTVPLDFLISAPGQAGVRTYLQLGAYYSHHFAGRAGPAAIDFGELYHNREFGLTYGLGLEIMRIRWGVHVRRGLSNLWLDPEAGVLVHENVYISLGYHF